jgi:putative ABC transport system permease protein
MFAIGTWRVGSGRNDSESARAASVEVAARYMIRPARGAGTVRSVASESSRTVHSIMEAAIQELRYAARRLARTPAFTLIAVATLSLAIGASTAAFSLVNGVLLKPLGFERPDRLVFLHGTDARQATQDITPQDLIDFQNQTHSFTAVVPFESGLNLAPLNLIRPKEPPLRIKAARVGAGFFSVLGTHAQLGRTFAPGEDARTANRVLVLSDGAWRRYFGANPEIIGTQVTLDGDLYVVVGVAPPRFTFPDDAELWYPAVWQDWEIGDVGRGNHDALGIARLRDGVTLASAQRDLSTVASRLAQAFPKRMPGSAWQPSRSSKRSWARSNGRSGPCWGP